MERYGPRGEGEGGEGTSQVEELKQRLTRTKVAANLGREEDEACRTEEVGRRSPGEEGTCSPEVSSHLPFCVETAPW